MAVETLTIHVDDEPVEIRVGTARRNDVIFRAELISKILARKDEVNNSLMLSKSTSLGFVRTASLASTVIGSTTCAPALRLARLRILNEILQTLKSFATSRTGRTIAKLSTTSSPNTIQTASSAIPPLIVPCSSKSSEC